jgi:glycosyltransferase involved in cell wall biosynthesis
MSTLERSMDNPTEIHLVSWNRHKMTNLVIRAINRNTFGPYRLIVLDNGSDQKTVRMLRRLQDQELIDELHLMPNNMGLEAARQYLFQSTKSEYFVDVDNDCLPPRGWLGDLERLMNESPNYAAIASRTQVMIGTGNIFENETEPITEFPHPGGSFRIMRTAAVKMVDGWDRFSPGRGSEERYICGKLRDNGWKTGFATGVKCLHLFGTRGDNPTDRWGYDSSLSPEDTGHSDISHPALTNGDDPVEVEKYVGETLTGRYFNDFGSN